MNERKYGVYSTVAVIITILLSYNLVLLYKVSSLVRLKGKQKVILLSDGCIYGL